MKEEPPAFIRKGFPRTRYYPKWKLLGWFPRGVLNEAFDDQVVEFIEMEERIQDAPSTATLTYLASAQSAIISTTFFGSPVAGKR